MRLKNTQILRAMYKHRALSVKQLSFLFDKAQSTITQHLQRLRKNNFVMQLRTPVGVFYYITSQGAKLLDFSRAYRTNLVNLNHTNFELKTIKYFIKKEKIKIESYDDLLNSYETERELKRRMFLTLGGRAHKLRWVDLLIKTSKGIIACEVELTKKNKYRYKGIVQKLDNQLSDEKWLKIVWVVEERYSKWFIKTISEANPVSTVSIITTKMVSDAIGGKNGPRK